MMLELGSENKGPGMECLEDLNEIKVDQAGIQAVEQWLRENEYNDIRIECLDKNVVEISASKKGRPLLVSVKSSVYPLDPGFLTIEEKIDLISRAKKQGASARFARVWLNEDLTLKDKVIMWARI